jgi:hypothetical protein
VNQANALSLGAAPRFLTLYLACACHVQRQHPTQRGMLTPGFSRSQAQLSTADTLIVATEARARTAAASTKCRKISACTGSLAAVSSGCH